MQNKPKQTKLFNLARKDYLHIFVACLLFLATVLATLSLKFLPTITGSVRATTDANLATNTITGDGGCSFTGTVTSAHSATISIGENSADFGSTKITTICSNSLDHQVYAVGYTGETEGNTNLVNSVDNTISIPTGTESGNISNWSMKISKDTSSYLPENLSLENNFGSNHVVPTESTLVSSYTGGTDTTTGSSIITTYSANVSNTQIAGNYAGVVKYVLTATTIYNVTIKTSEGIEKISLNGVECTSTEGCVVTGLISGQSYALEVTPASGYEFTGWGEIASGEIGDETTTSTTYTIGEANETLEPEAERLIALLDTGQNLNYKLKTIANSKTISDYQTQDHKIKTIRRSNTLPNDFVASSLNTISLVTSTVPVYIFFDDTNDSGIIYYYARNNAKIIANSDMKYSFVHMYALESVPGLSGWDTGEVTNMMDMFYYDQSLMDISGLAYWNTSKVRHMGDLFARTNIADTNALVPGKNGDTNIWNTENVLYMQYMFNNVTSLTDISGLANWNTSNVKDMDNMFSATRIANVDALATGKNSNPNIWNTENVTNMSKMFSGISTLSNITGLSGWNTSKVKNMDNMFSNDSSLTDISSLSNWVTADTTTMSYMFSKTKITNVDALATGKNGNPDIWNTGNVTNMSGLFNSITSLTDISGISEWDTSKVTNMSYMFSSIKITNVDALATGKNGNPNIWNTGNVTNMSNMFSNATSLTDISGLSNWDTAKVTNMSYLFSDATSLADISGLSSWNTANVTTMTSMFVNTKITNVDALATGKNSDPNVWNTGNVTNMNSLFYGASSLENISGLANWDTAKVTYMQQMFTRTAITNVDALATGKNGNPNIWNTGNVTYMSSLFLSTALENISGLANWDTAKVMNIQQMFGDTKITNVDALATGKNGNPNIWNTGNVNNMASLFWKCSLLTDIAGLANWDTSKVTTMTTMFYNTRITNVDALATGKNDDSKIWNVGNVTSMESMFNDNPALTDISNLVSWDTSNVKSMKNMFSNDTSLTTLSPIASWDVGLVTATAGDASDANKFYYMFNSLPSTVTSGFSFTTRPGTINSDGTYVPSS